MEDVPALIGLGMYLYIYPDCITGSVKCDVYMCYAGSQVETPDYMSYYIVNMLPALHRPAVY